MYIYPLRRLLLYFFLWTCACPVLAQLRTPVTFLDAEHGLSNNNVRCITKDHNGFMWIGTRDGLDRYDGNTFTVWRHQFKDTNSLICNFVLTLAVDHAGLLWIGTREGLDVYNSLTGRFSVVTWGHGQPLTGLIKELKEDGKGNMLIGVQGLGLLIKRPGASPALQVPLDGSYLYGVQSIQAGEDGRIWVQVQNKGLCLFDEPAGRLHLVNTQLPLASALEQVGGTLWLASGESLYTYSNGACIKKWTLPAGGSAPDEIWSFARGKNGHFLLGTRQGRLLEWDALSGELFSQDLHYGTIYGLFADDVAWLGTAKGGLGLIDPGRSRFHTEVPVPASAGRPPAFVTSLVETGNGNLVVATESDGVLLFDRRTERFTSYRGPTSISDMTGDAAGQVWIAANYGGVDRFDPVTHQFRRYRCTPEAGGIDNFVWTVYEDKQRNLWAATLRQGSIMGALFRFDRAADRFVLFDSSLSDLFTLYEDREGVLWAGNLNQLVDIDRVHHRHRFYTINSALRAIWEDKNGDLWLGTEGGGLLRFDRQTHKIVRRYTTDDGLCHNSVLNILEDKEGGLWLSTGGGLSRFSPSSGNFRNYYQSDGLQSNEFLFNSALRLRSGELAFGGIKGFNIFDPAAILETGQMPPLRLTGITVNGTAVEKNPGLVSRWGANQVEAIRVPFDKAFFSFDFTTLDYSTPQSITYAYYMEGWDGKWTEAGTQRKATYTHLNEGSYTFRVRSTNTEGKWNPQEIALSIVVLPPWYRTWWAYCFYGLILLSLARLYWIYRERQTKLKYQVALERQKADEQRSFFTNISHEFRTPLTLIINPVKDLLTQTERRAPDFSSPEEAAFERAELQVIHRNARRMLSLVDQLLLFGKADSDRLTTAALNLRDVCHEVYLSFSQQARAKNIHYTFSDEGDMEVYADREKVEIILFNLVSNALKYTPPDGFVSMRLRRGPAGITVEVADSGSGIPAEAGERIFERFYQAAGAATKPGFGIGLFLARQFTLAHKGALSYRSEEGKGTVFTLCLPVGHVPMGSAPVGAATAGEPMGAAPAERQPVRLFQELLVEEAPAAEAPLEAPPPLVEERKSILVVDDDTQLRQYIVSSFRERFTVHEATGGEEGMRLALEHYPDIVISDICMEGKSGIDLCKTLKGNPATAHIPVILLTGTLAAASRLEGIEGGADDYITKPFDMELLQARVANLLQSRSQLRQSIFNEITHNEAPRKISATDKAFLDRCTAVIESHLLEEDFSIAQLSVEMGISHSSLYKKVKALSGQSLNGFIRLVRLRNAAILCINSDYNVNEIATMIGIIDRTHFREQFQKVYGMTAAEYIRKYRKPLASQYTVKKPK
ncbi:signal transduction histidine kinase [Dinghuibacter silviterrae]|uniref:histidine kinase n=1 Tax=Dinghuibacter silviterrae TaxID=1539049 RepID=A0A4R8DF83_9BACT|nr:signal transduction histidine kinase [Dinghuibacter silviterrae]